MKKTYKKPYIVIKKTDDKGVVEEKMMFRASLDMILRETAGEDLRNLTKVRLWSIEDAVVDLPVPSRYDLFKNYTYAEEGLARLFTESYRLEMNGKDKRNLKPMNNR